MTVEEAINLLDEVSSKFMGSRADHEMLKEAVQVIRESCKDDKTEEQRDHFCLPDFGSVEILGRSPNFEVSNGKNDFIIFGFVYQGK